MGAEARSEQSLWDGCLKDPCLLLTTASRRIRYDTIEEISVDSKAEYTA